MLEFDFRIYQQFYASLAFSWCNLQGISWGREKTEVCICNLPKILLMYMHGNMLWLHWLNPYPFFFDYMGPLEFNILIFLEKNILLGKKNGTWKKGWGWGLPLILWVQTCWRWSLPMLLWVHTCTFKRQNISVIQMEVWMSFL